MRAIHTTKTDTNRLQYWRYVFRVHCGIMELGEVSYTSSHMPLYTRHMKCTHFTWLSPGSYATVYMSHGSHATVHMSHDCQLDHMPLYTRHMIVTWITCHCAHVTWICHCAHVTWLSPGSHAPVHCHMDPMPLYTCHMIVTWIFLMSTSRKAFRGVIISRATLSSNLFWLSPILISTREQFNR